MLGKLSTQKVRAQSESCSFLGSKLVLGLFFGSTFFLALDLELGLLLVELHELSKIELGLLEKLDLSDEDVLEGEDFAALLGDLLSNRVGNAKRYN